MVEFTGGELVAKSLKKEGVKYTFTLCGSGNLPILNACIDQGIDLIDMRHEQAVANAAQGYSIASHKPGICMIVGQGVFNVALRCSLSVLHLLPHCCYIKPSTVL